MNSYMSEINKSRQDASWVFYSYYLCSFSYIMCRSYNNSNGGKSDFNWLGVSEFILSIAALYAAGATGKYFQKKIENNTQN
jgi:hypothetical protein